MPINIDEAYRGPNRLDQKRNSTTHIIIKIPNAQSKERILKAVREKGQVTCIGRPDFSPETMTAITPQDYDILGKCHRDRKRTQILAHTTIASKLLMTIDGKPRYSMIKPNLHNIFPQIQPFKG